MEGFADGIRSVVSQNWTALAHSMQVVECVPDPVKRDLDVGRWKVTTVVFFVVWVCYTQKRYGTPRPPPKTNSFPLKIDGWFR